MDDSRHARFVLLWTGILAAIAAVLTIHPEHETDPFWHMTLGRAVLEHGSRTIPEPNSFLTLGQAIVVPEWLWGVLTYTVYQWFGETVLTLLPMLFAALAAVAVVQLVRIVEPSARREAIMLVSALVVMMILARMRLRPQTAFMAILPAYLFLAEAYVKANGRRAVMLGTGIVITQLLWTQLHGSFVLGPAIFSMFVLADILRQPSSGNRARHGLVFVGLLLACLTSSYGTDIGRYILSHSGGDAKQHIGDMLSATWAGFNPWRDGYVAIYLGLMFLSLVACLKLGRQVRVELIALSVLGVALYLTAHRFLDAAAVLAAPLAIQGAQILLQPVRSRPVMHLGVAVLIVLALFKTLSTTLDFFGPFGTTGFTPSGYPYAANTYLRNLPKPVSVLTDYGTGESLTFWQQGQVYAYVDSRTPLHFNDTQFAVSRDLSGSANALALIVDRYGLEIAVVQRTNALCGALAKTWQPVVVEPLFTTFVRRKDAPVIHTVAPCGDYFATPKMCERGGEKFAQDMALLQRYIRPSFYGYLKAEHILRCGGEIAEVPGLLPSKAESWYYRGQADMTRALWLLKTGRVDDAVTLLAPLLRIGNLEAFSLIEPWITAGQVEPAAVYGPLADLVKVHDDRTPVNVREALARTCMRLGRVDCVQFHGTRSALQGSKYAKEILGWLAVHHADARERLEAQTWLSIIEKRGSGKRR